MRARATPLLTPFIGKIYAMLPPMQKLYCYVDEAGQHTEGRLFVVSVAIIDSLAERDRIGTLLEAIEAVSHKRKQKWRTSRHTERFAYMTAIITNENFKGLLHYQVHFNSRDYVEMTVRTTAGAMRKVAAGGYKATVLVDGLPDSQRHAFGIALRQRGIQTKKVHGVDDRKEAFIRLADALCGFIVDAYEGNALYSDLLQRGLENRHINLVE